MDARQHRDRIQEILAEIDAIGYALPGSIVTRATACGKPGCRCKADPPELHGPYTSWLRRDGGRPVTRALTPAQEERYRPWFDNDSRLRELAADLVTEIENLSVEAFDQAEGTREQRKPRSHGNRE